MKPNETTLSPIKPLRVAASSSRQLILQLTMADSKTQTLETISTLLRQITDSDIETNHDARWARLSVRIREMQRQLDAIAADNSTADDNFDSEMTRLREAHPFGIPRAITGPSEPLPTRRPFVFSDTSSTLSDSFSFGEARSDSFGTAHDQVPDRPIPLHESTHAHFHRLPEETMLHNLNTAPKQPCTACGNPVRATIQTECRFHRNNHAPAYGWGFFTRGEFAIVNAIRRKRIESTVLEFANNCVGDECDTSDSELESESGLTEATGELNMDSGDEL